MKRSVILIDRLGPVTLSVLWMKGQVLHLLRVQLKCFNSSMRSNERVTTIPLPSLGPSIDVN